MPRCEGGRQRQRIEPESKEMNMLRQKVHDAYAQMLDLTLYGEKVLEWNAEDTLVYRGKRLAMFVYPVGYIL